MVQRGLFAVLEDQDALRQSLAAQLFRVHIQVAAGAADEAGQRNAALIGRNADDLAIKLRRLTAPDLQLGGAAQELDGSVPDDAHGIAPGTGAAGFHGPGHLAVLRQQQRHLVAGLELGEALRGRGQRRQLHAAQDRDAGGFPGAGLAALVVHRHPGVADPDGIGGAGIGRHIVLPQVAQSGGGAVFVDAVSGHAAGDGVKAHGGAVLIDDDRRLSLAAAAHEHIGHGAGAVQAQRDGIPGVEPREDRRPGSLCAVVIGSGVTFQRVLDAAGVCDLRRGAGGDGDRPVGAGGVRHKGHGLAVLVQQQGALPSVQDAAGRLAGGQRKLAAVGRLEGLAVISGGGGRQHGVPGGAEGRKILGAVLLLRPEQVQKQLRRLAPGQGGVAVVPHAVGESDGGGYGHVAVRPHAAHVLILVAQQPQQDGGRLAQGDGALRVEFAVRIAGNDVLPLGRHIDVGGGPVGGLHIREHRDGAVQAQLALAVHGVDRHFAELRPVQLGGGAEAAVAVAVQHTHQPQGLHRHGGILVADVGKADGIRRRGGHSQQGRCHAHRQQQRENSLFHICFPPYSARRASTGWSLDAFTAG